MTAADLPRAAVGTWSHTDLLLASLIDLIGCRYSDVVLPPGLTRAHNSTEPVDLDSQTPE